MRSRHVVGRSVLCEAGLVARTAAAGNRHGSSPRNFVVKAIVAALFAPACGQAMATNLIFDASPPAITSALTADTSFWVGQNSPNVSVTIAAGGSVTVNAGGNSATVGLNAASSGNSLGISGAGAALHVGETIYVGYKGASNALSVGSGGSADALDLWIGGIAGSTGNSVTISGTGTVSATHAVILGYGAGGNSIMVQSGGHLTSPQVSVGFVAAAPSNIATVTDGGSVWSSTGHFLFGEASGGNQLTIQNGGKVAVDGNAFDTLLGANPGSDANQILVTGPGSVLSNQNGTLYVGRGGSANSLQIKSGGLVSSKNVRIGGGTGGTGNPTGNGAVVDGTGSNWNITGTLRVGAGTVGTNSGLDITAGGVVTVSGNSFLGYDASSDGNHVLVSGAGSKLNAQALTIGNAPGSINNVVTLANGGVLAAASIAIGDTSGLVIGAGGASGSISSPTTITGAGTGSYVRFNHTDSSYTFPSALAGTVAVTHDGAGTTSLTGANTYTGATTVNAGTLYIDGITSTSGIAVNAGATLGVPAGVTGTTVGNYTQNATGTFRTLIASNSTYGRLVVDGTVNLAPNALIDVQVANCSAIAPGTVFAGVISSNNNISVTSYAVTDNCDGLIFTARRNANGNAVDLVASGLPLIPTLSQWGLVMLSGLLALGAMAGLLRRRRGTPVRIS